MRAGVLVRGLSFGLAAGLLVATVMSVADWVENPQGIFHADGATHWSFVRQTWISWFLPVTLSAMVTGAALCWWRAKPAQ